MFDCQRFKDLEEWVVLNNAMDYYNQFYEPPIFIEQLQSLKQIYDTTVVQGRKRYYSIIKNNNVCARFITPKEKCLVFDDGEHIEILKEKEVTDNPFYKVRKGIYEKTKVKEIQTDLENIELLKYDYSRKHVGKRRYLSRNQKKKIKRASFSDKFCIKETLKAKRVIIKNMLAIKLAKVNFKNNFGKMQEYNELLKEYGCIFYFVSFGIMNINRFTEFDGNILVIKKTGIGTGYHMIPLRKWRIESPLFEKDKVLQNNENAEFYVYQYHLEIQTQKKVKRGRKLGLKLLNKLI